MQEGQTNLEKVLEALKAKFPNASLRTVNETVRFNTLGLGRMDVWNLGKISIMTEVADMKIKRSGTGLTVIIVY